MLSLPVDRGIIKLAWVLTRCSNIWPWNATPHASWKSHQSCECTYTWKNFRDIKNGLSLEPKYLPKCSNAIWLLKRFNNFVSSSFRLWSLWSLAQKKKCWIPYLRWMACGLNLKQNLCKWSRLWSGTAGFWCLFACWTSNPYKTYPPSSHTCCMSSYSAYK